MDNFQLGLEALKYEQFFEKYGIRNAARLLNGRFHSLANFELPRSAIVHFLAESTLTLGIEPTNLLIAKSKGVTVTKHISKLATRIGNPIDIPIPVTQFESKYRKQYRTIRPMKDIRTATRDVNNIVVINYSILPHLYKYRVTFQTRLFSFQNTLATMVATMNDLAEESAHNQFLRLDLPEVVPTRQQFIKGSAAPLNRVTLPLWPDDRSLLLLELWKWLGDGRQQSILAGLTSKALSKINLVLMESGKYAIINLGKLDEWRADTTPQGEDEDDATARARQSGMSPAQMQLNFLKFLTTAYSIRSVAAKSLLETVVETDEDGDEVETVTGGQIEGEELTDEDLDTLDDMSDETVYNADGDIIDGEPEVVTTYIPPVEDTSEVAGNVAVEYTGGVVQASMDLLNDGLITMAEHRRFERLSHGIEKIQSPWGGGSIIDFANTPPKVISEGISEGNLKQKTTVFDKSLLKSSLRDFDKDYIEQVMHYDIARVILDLQKQGLIVKDIKVKENRDVNNEHELLTISVLPVGGSPSSLNIQIPKIRADGTYLSGGVKYRLRKQRGDLPIRKVSPTRVSLTSYASKLMVDRSERKVNNYGDWLHRQITMQLTDESSKLKISGYGNVYDTSVKVPRVFSILGQRYTGITKGSLKLIFDLKELERLYPEELKATLAHGDVIIGTLGKKLLTMSNNGVIAAEASSEILGSIEDCLGIEPIKVPVEQVDVNIYGQRIPVAVILAYEIGFSNLLRTMNAKYRQVLKGARLDLKVGEWVVKFADQTLIFEPDQKEVEYVVNSLNSFKSTIVGYDYEEFDNQEIWGTLLEQEGLGVRYIREVASLHAGFIDPITMDILIDYDFPTTFQGLVHESVRMLLTDDHPDEMDGDYMRIKGYERIPGLIYSQLMKSVRQYKSRPLTAKSSMELHPYAVWTELQSDPSVSIVEDSNPIHQLKESENITYSGKGGRSSRTMVRRTRAFNKNDMGLISEATVDSSDVGVTIYSSPNPKFKDIRGTSKAGVDLTNNSSLMSTSALLCPASDKDDPKRINFISIQMSHVVACKGYGSFPVRTGYEQCIGQRTGSLFTVRARGEGVVTKVKSDHMVIQYDQEDLALDHISLGRTYGTVTGKTVPHDIVTDHKEGDRITDQSVVAWNSGFFERDFFNPDDVVWMSGIPIKVALLDGHETIEDSCRVSEDVVRKLEMSKTGLRELTFTIDQEINELVSVGEELDSESILCIVEDSSTAGLDLFNDSTLDTLSVMSRNSPRAQYSGKVGKVEVIYNGDYDDMSPSVRAIVEQADRERGLKAKRMKSDEVRTGYASDLAIDTVIIKVYIDSSILAADGDKAVVGHQLKTVIGNVMHGVNETESGIPIDVQFGYLSVEDRMTGAVIAQGTAATIIRLAGLRAVDAYLAKL